MKVLSLVIISSIAISCNAQQQEKNPEKRKRPSPEQLMKDMDTNEDQKISKKEAKGPISKDFDVIDANKDGFITLAELKKAPKPKRPKAPKN